METVLTSYLLSFLQNEGYKFLLLKTTYRSSGKFPVCVSMLPVKAKPSYYSFQFDAYLKIKSTPITELVETPQEAVRVLLSPYETTGYKKWLIRCFNSQAHWNLLQNLDAVHKKY